MEDTVMSIINNKKIEASYAVTMISQKTCNLVYWFDDFIQDGDELVNKVKNPVILTNAKYYRIPPNYSRQSCKKSMINPPENPVYRMSIKERGGKRKKIHTQRTKRKRTKRTRRTKRR